MFIFFKLEIIPEKNHLLRHQTTPVSQENDEEIQYAKLFDSGKPLICKYFKNNDGIYNKLIFLL